MAWHASFDPRGRKLPIIRGVVLVFVVATIALGVLYGAALASVGSGVLPGTTVDGVSVGGLSVIAAERKLLTALGPNATASPRVRVLATTRRLPERSTTHSRIVRPARVSGVSTSTSRRRCRKTVSW